MCSTRSRLVISTHGRGVRPGRCSPRSQVQARFRLELSSGSLTRAVAKVVAVDGEDEAVQQECEHAVRFRNSCERTKGVHQPRPGLSTGSVPLGPENPLPYFR